LRSILQNKFDEFLEILKHDKTSWLDFWRSYRKKFEPIVFNYEKAHDLNDEKIEKILQSFSRAFLDSLKQRWEEIKHQGKRKVALELRKRSGELQLSKEDFVVFLFGGLGLSVSTVVKGSKEKVILIDLVKVWKDGKLGELERIVLESVKNFRKGDVYGG